MIRWAWSMPVGEKEDAPRDGRDSWETPRVSCGDFIRKTMAGVYTRNCDILLWSCFWEGRFFEMTILLRFFCSSYSGSTAAKLAGCRIATFSPSLSFFLSFFLFSLHAVGVFLSFVAVFFFIFSHFYFYFHLFCWNTATWQKKRKKEVNAISISCVLRRPSKKLRISEVIWLCVHHEPERTINRLIDYLSGVIQVQSPIQICQSGSNFCLKNKRKKNKLS